MEPEAFDQFCQRKLAQLTQVPDLEWEEENVWQKIRRRLRGGSFGLRHLSVLLLLVSTLGWFTFIRPDNRTATGHARTQRTVKQPAARPDAVADPPDSKPAVSAVNPKVNKAQAVGKASFRRTPVDTTKTLRIVRQLPDGPLQPKTTQPSASIPKMQPKGMAREERPLRALRVPTDPVPEDRAGRRQRKETEHYLASGENGHVTGLRQVWHVSQRVSLVHGLQVRQSFTAGLPPETTAGLQYALALPLEVRYYLLPKEKRFTAFLYGNVSPSVAFSQAGSPVGRRPVDLSLQAGAEARYRLFNARHGSGAFFFVRLPVYQRSLLPLTPSSRGQ